MEAKELLRGQFKTMHQFMDMTIGDCTQDVADKKEDSWTINKIGSLYAHVYLAEDMFIKGMARGEELVLNKDGWADKLGVDTAQPRQDEELANMPIDIEKFREYAKAVAAATDDFFENATDEDLSKEVEGPVGKQPLAVFLSTIGVTHIAGHWGEIAALKGVQGLKGLPF